MLIYGVFPKVKDNSACCLACELYNASRAIMQCHQDLLLNCTRETLFNLRYSMRQAPLFGSMLNINLSNVCCTLASKMTIVVDDLGMRAKFSPASKQAG